MTPALEENAWSRILEELRERISEQKYQTWFHPIRPLEISEDRIILEVPNPFFVDWFEEHNLPLLKSAIEHKLGTNPQIRFTVPENYQSHFKRSYSPTLESVKPLSSPTACSGRRAHNLNPRFTFDNFVVGRGNEFTYAACKGVAADPAKAYNPLFIHGGVGLGKTHIMQATGAELLRANPSAKAFYLSAETFMNQMIESIQRGTTLDFRERYRGLDVLLIDDIQFMSGKESTQEEFFHTFNTLHDADKQVIVTSDRAPKNILELEERLISRFNCGLVCDIQPPDLETRVAILRHKAEQESIVLPDSVLFFIAESIRTNVRELEGSLVRLSALASLSGSPITLDLAKDVLKDYIRDREVRPIDVRSVQEMVAAHFELPTESLRGKRRTSTVALARQVAMYLTKQLTTMTLVEIGRRFGNRDHSTVLHACSKISKKMQVEEEFNDLVTRIRKSLSESDGQRS